MNIGNRKNVLRGAAIILTLLLLLSWLAVFIGGKNALRQARAQLEAAGRPMTLEEILPPPVAPEDDAAPLLLQLFPLLESDILAPDELMALFPGLQDVLIGTNSPQESAPPESEETSEPGLVTSSFNRDEYYSMLARNIAEEETFSALDMLTWCRPQFSDSEKEQAEAYYSALYQRGSIKKVLQLLHEAANKKYCRGDLEKFSDPHAFPLTLQPTLTATQLLCNKATADQSTASWPILIEALKLNLLIRNEPNINNLLISEAGLEMISKSIREISSTSVIPQNDSAILQELLQQFDDHSVMHQGLDYWRLVSFEQPFNEGFHTIYRDSEYYKKISWQDKGLITAWNMFTKNYDHAAGLPLLLTYHKSLDAPHISTTLSDIASSRDTAPLLYLITKSHYPGHYIDEHLLAITNSHLMRIGLTAIAYQQDHGSYPATIEKMNMQHLLDPFSEKPFIYKPSPDGFLLYSIGPNQIDDAGANDDIPWQHSVPET